MPGAGAFLMPISADLCQNPTFPMPRFPMLSAETLMPERENVFSQWENSFRLRKRRKRVFSRSFLALYFLRLSVYRRFWVHKYFANRLFKVFIEVSHFDFPEGLCFTKNLFFRIEMAQKMKNVEHLKPSQLKCVIAIRNGFENGTIQWPHLLQLQPNLRQYVLDMILMHGAIDQPNCISTLSSVEFLDGLTSLDTQRGNVDDTRYLERVTDSISKENGKTIGKGIRNWTSPCTGVRCAKIWWQIWLAADLVTEEGVLQLVST